MKKIRSLLLCICAVLAMSATAFAGNVHYTVEKISAFTITFSDKYYVRPMILTVYDNPVYWEEGANLLDTWYTADSLTHSLTGLKAGTYYVFMEDDPASDAPAYVKHGPAQRYTIDVLEDMDPASPNVYAITAETFLDFPEHENHVTITGDDVVKELAEHSPRQVYIYKADGTYYEDYRYTGKDISVTGIPDGSYILSVDGGTDQIPFKVDYYNQDQTVIIPSSIAFPQTESSIIQVSVKDRVTGDLVSQRASLTLYDSKGSQMDFGTTDDGEYTFYGLTHGIYKIVVELEDGTTQETRVNLVSDSPTAKVSVYIDDEQPMCQVGVEFKYLHNDSRIHGDIPFEVAGADGTVEGSYVAQDGTYSLDLVPGDYTIIVRMPDGPEERQEIIVSSNNPSTTQTVYLASAAIPSMSYRVRLALRDRDTGAPATVYEGQSVRIFDTNGTLVGTYTVGEDGICDISPMEAGEYQLEFVSEPEYYQIGPDRVPFTVSPDEADDIEIPVDVYIPDPGQPPVAYSVQVEFWDTVTGKQVKAGLAGAKVALSDATGTILGTYQVGEDAVCMIDSIASGDYSVALISAPGQYQSEPVAYFTVGENQPYIITIPLDSHPTEPVKECEEHTWDNENYGEPHYKEGTTKVIVSRTCTTCGYEEEKEWAPTIRKEIEKAFSCTEPDILITYSDIFDGKQVLYDQEISREEIPAKYTEHDWTEWKMTQEATEEQDGVKERHCTRCDVFEAVLIPHDGTDIGTPPAPLPADDEPGEEGEKESEEEKPASPSVKIGTSFTSGNYKYKVTAKNTVTFTGCTKKLKKISIPSSVTYNGLKFSVTEIGKGAVKANAKLVRLSIPATIRKIGPEAFKACKNLKTVVVKTQKLSKKTLGANAFKGIHKKAVFKVPKAKKKAYKKLFKGYTVK